MASSDEKLVEQLASRINVKIANGEFPPGTRLRQEALADEFSVSRTPIREALRQLEAQGVIVHIANRGAIVRTPDVREIREAYQVRAELEGLAAELAVNWITDQQLQLMHRAQKMMIEAFNRASKAPRKTTKKAPNWVEANDDFHGVILKASGNRHLTKIVQNLHAGFIRKVMMSASSMDSRQTRENVAQHEAILDALQRHDAFESRRLTRHHILRSGDLMVAWLESHADVP